MSKSKTEPLYTYNQEAQTYIIPLKSRSRPLVIKAAKHKAIKRAFSDMSTPTLSVEEVALKFKIPVAYLEEYKRIFGMTRDSLPLTDEEISEKSVEELVEEVMEDKRFSILQGIQKLDWKETQQDATQWRKFEVHQLDPFVQALENWTPPKIAKKTPIGLKKPAPKTLLFCLSDWHVGGLLDKSSSYFPNVWNVEEFHKFKDEYISQLIQILHTHPHDKIVITFLGDLLDGLRGKTEKGTVLTPEKTRDQQFLEALNGCIEILQTFVENTHANIDIHGVRGNHDSVDFFILLETVKRCFKDNAAMRFINHSSRNGFFEEKGCLFCIDHGAHDIIDAKIPQNAKLESYIQSLWIQYAELNKLPKHKYFIQGDLHHFETCEYNDFEFIMCGSPAKSLYSEVNNWRSRPHQIWLGVTSRGVEEIHKIFVD